MASVGIKGLEGINTVCCRWSGDQSSLAGVDGGCSADGATLQDGTTGGVSHLFYLP